MMKRTWKWVAAVVALAVLAGLWSWRYQAAQAQFAPLLQKTETRYYEMGEFVSVGPITGYKTEDISGCSFRVNSREFVDCQAYLREKGMEDLLSGEERGVPDKLLLVSVTVRNEENSFTAFSLYALNLAGTGVMESLHDTLLQAINPELEGTTLNLALGDEYTVTIPYALERSHFSGGTWRHLDSFDFYVGVQEVADQLTRRYVKLG